MRKQDLPVEQDGDRGDRASSRGRRHRVHPREWRRSWSATEGKAAVAVLTLINPVELKSISPTHERILLLAKKLPSSSSKTATVVASTGGKAVVARRRPDRFVEFEDQFATHSRAHRLELEKLPLIHPRKRRRSWRPIEGKAAVALLRHDQSARLEMKSTHSRKHPLHLEETAEFILENGGDPAVRLNACGK